MTFDSLWEVREGCFTFKIQLGFCSAICAFNARITASSLDLNMTKTIHFVQAIKNNQGSFLVFFCPSCPPPLVWRQQLRFANNTFHKRKRHQKMVWNKFKDSSLCTSEAMAINDFFCPAPVTPPATSKTWHLTTCEKREKGASHLSFN